MDDWRTHLTTLFPEVRPKGFAEVRACDAVDPARYAAPLVLLAGIAYDPRAAAEAGELVGAPDPALLVRAGRDGLRDPALAAAARDLADIAMGGARRLGPAFVSGAALEEAEAFFDAYTRRGRSPADDVSDAFDASASVLGADALAAAAEV
jgi:glutamate--cysteine ligase